MISDVGAEKYVHGRLGRERITVRADKNAPLASRSRAVLGIDGRRLHFFRQGRRV